jgi:hypothetical protein
MNTHSQITEAELMETTKPPAKLSPGHVKAESLGEEGLRNGALHRKALGWSSCPLKPSPLQLPEFALASVIRCLGSEQLHEEASYFLTKCRGRLSNINSMYSPSC